MHYLEVVLNFLQIVFFRLTVFWPDTAVIMCASAHIRDHNFSSTAMEMGSDGDGFDVFHITAKIML